GVHLYVGREEVVATFGAVLDDVIAEVLGMQALTLQAPLHVGERNDHRVDLVGVDPGFEIGQGEVTIVSSCYVHRVRSSAVIPIVHAATLRCRRNDSPSLDAPSSDYRRGSRR